MTLLFNFLLTAGGLFYFLLLAMIIAGLLKLKFSKPSRSNDSRRVSIIIAARDEEENLPATLQSLINQDYPSNLIEIVVVNDRSRDGTSSVVSELSQRDKRIKLVNQTSINPAISPKKQALERGIEVSTGEIILVTDADCSPPDGWIREMVGGMTSQAGMVAGQSRFSLPDNPPLWQKLQALDFQSMGYASAGLIGFGMPFTCSGASLAYRRKLYDDVDGWQGCEQLISGDDELLMAKATRTDWQVRAATSRSAIVNSLPVRSLKELWNQRLRWGSKGLYYHPSRKIILAGVFLFLVTMTAGPVVWLTTGSASYWLAWAAFRLVLDSSVIALGASLFKEKISIFEFIILEIIYPPLTILFASAGHFQSFEWKGQLFGSKGGSR